VATDKTQDLIERALRNQRESKYIEFKSEFDVTSKQAWCEIIKDFAAMANSGGGAIAVGLDNQGQPTSADVLPLLKLDPAKISDKIERYTSSQFDAFQLFDAEKNGAKVAILVVGEAANPLVFTRPGTYSVSKQEQKSAFRSGTMYFRHGAKSEPASPGDVSGYVALRIDRARREWMKRVRRVVQAPPGYEVRVLPRAVYETDSEDASPIRIVEDESAPGYRKIDPDKTHPFRQKELLREVNRLLPEESRINSYDVQAMRRVHGTDSESRFFYKPKFGSPQYSKELAGWIVDQFNEDPHFFEKVRERDSELRQRRH
jgi:hypothetical protein